jgi:hypothetical protein
MEITIIWDTVNTASRIEGMTRTSKQNIVIAESTYKSISNNKIFTIDEVWLKKLRWKKDKIKIYWVQNHINIRVKKKKQARVVLKYGMVFLILFLILFLFNLLFDIHKEYISVVLDLNDRIND